MFSFFKKNKQKEKNIEELETIESLDFLGGDMHSHLVPGIDDGSQNFEDSVFFLESLMSLGLSKFITTPHIHGEMYDNDTIKVQKYFQQLKDYFHAHHPEVYLRVSAEYFLDNYFISNVLPKGLMSFGNNQVLVEVSMAGWNRQFDDMIFAIQSNGYSPILAHPERYIYETNMDVFSKLKDKGIELQLNLLSVMGYYGKSIQINAQKLLDMKLYDYCGTDLHHKKHLTNIQMIFKDNQNMLNQLKHYGFRNSELYR